MRVTFDKTRPFGLILQVKRKHVGHTARRGFGLAFPAWYGIIVGIGMIAQWAFFLATGQVPELVTEPVRISFHLAAETVTALALIVGGVGLLANRRWARKVALIANGMLVYTAIISPGYFAQSGDWPLVAMFAVILAFALLSIVILLRTERRRPASA